MSRYVRQDRRGRRIRGDSATSAVRHKMSEGLRVACFGSAWYLQRNSGPREFPNRQDRWVSVGGPTTREHAIERMNKVAGGAAS